MLKKRTKRDGEGNEHNGTYSLYLIASGCISSFIGPHHGFASMLLFPVVFMNHFERRVAHTELDEYREKKGMTAITPSGTTHACNMAANLHSPCFRHDSILHGSSLSGSANEPLLAS
ncbi:hypothetical protein Trydic_g7956 [Trypoxylus dichotomus]